MRQRFFFHRMATVNVILINWALSAWSICGCIRWVSLAWAACKRVIGRTWCLHENHCKPSTWRPGPSHSRCVWMLFSATGLFCRTRLDVSRRRAAVQTQQKHPVMQTALETAGKGYRKLEASRGEKPQLQIRILNVQVHITALWFEMTDGGTGMWLNNFT